MWVYALYNANEGKTYIGQTSNIEKRFVEHNLKRGNHFTSKFEGEWIVICKEAVADRRSALIREKELKSYRGREYIKQYIPSKDLAPR